MSIGMVLDGKSEARFWSALRRHAVQVTITQEEINEGQCNKSRYTNGSQ